MDSFAFLMIFNTNWIRVAKQMSHLKQEHINMEGWGCCQEFFWTVNQL